MIDPTLTPSRLWKQLTPERRLRVARAFWLEDQARDDHVQAALLIAQRKKFRPKTIASLDDDRKARHLASLVAVPDAIAARALIAYHLGEQRLMMASFLDALGMVHDNGLIQDNDAKPDSSKLASAAADLAARFPPEDVALYFNTLLSQDPDTWGGLADLVPTIEKA